jgi:hypothetical protein
MHFSAEECLLACVSAANWRGNRKPGRQGRWFGAAGDIVRDWLDFGEWKTRESYSRLGAPWIMTWRLQGLWQYLRGDHEWKPLKRKGLASAKAQ